MLVLGRKTNESIVIGDNVVVTILSVDHDKVTIGIQAPREITILREEIFQAVKEQDLIATHLVQEPTTYRFENLRALLVSEEPSSESVA